MFVRIAWTLPLVAVLMTSSGGGAALQPNPARPAATVAGGTQVNPAPSTRSRKLETDTSITTPSGATFQAAAGWTVEETSDRVILTTPEDDLTMVVLETKGADRDAAIAAAWARWRADFNLAVAQAVDLPARDGWDAVAQVVYVTPAAERRFVAAIARRKGEVWYVALVDGTQAAAARRGAQLGTAVESFTLPGLDKESFAGRTAHPLDKARADELSAFIETARARSRVPGAAVAVVQGGKVVFARGFGVRELGEKAQVTPRTLFMIGSVGKSLTTLMLARLVEAGAFGWDTPVTRVLPSFALGDAATTAAVKMRHTACACTGMPRQDLEFLFEGDVSPEERIASMRSMAPTTGFGETFQYSNLMVSAGGFAAAHARTPRLKLGPAYDGAMNDLVFKPLGMKSTTFDFKAVGRTDHAAPHPFNLHGEPTALPYTIESWVEPLRPAGGAWSNLEDMARVILLELGRGKLAGRRIVGEEALLARRQPQVKISSEMSYGLGLAVGTSLGLQVLTHSGGTMGFTTELLILPEHDVGLIILSNVGSGGIFTSSVERRLLELLFDGRAEAADDLERNVTLTRKLQAEELALIEVSPDAAWFATLTGSWNAPGLGRIDLRTERGNPVLDTGGWKVAVGRKKDRDGTIKIVATSAPFAGLELIPVERDGRTVLLLEDSQRSYTFERTTK